jgi:hypothetical protein
MNRHKTQRIIACGNQITVESCEIFVTCVATELVCPPAACFETRATDVFM